MSYTPINWQTGDTITAEKMNKMDNGWGVGTAQLFSETVTTTTTEGQPAPIAPLTYGSQLSASTLTVTFDNVDYVCSAIDLGGVIGYGEFGEMGPVFTTYPFFIISAVDGGGSNLIYTENVGTHAVAVSGDALQVSTNFAEAVNACIIPQVFVAESDVTTWQEIHDAMVAGKIVCLIENDNNGNVIFQYVLTVRTNNYEVVALRISSDNFIGPVYYNANSASSPIYPN